MLNALGKYRIIQKLGQGGMGEVYLGEDPVLGRTVAIKTIRPESGHQELLRERLAREAKAAASLNHPNIVTVHEMGEDQGTLFLVMEFARGEDLEALLRKGELNLAEVLEILAQICDGLSEAHRMGVLHRDIKPSNIRVLRESGRIYAKLLDFGIARIKDSTLTTTGTAVGTVSYMAPEYIRHSQADPRSDLFAIGVMLYEALAGKPPFTGETTATILYRIVNEDPPPLDTGKLSGLGPGLLWLVGKSLAKDPEQRFQTASELARWLRAALEPGWTGPLAGHEETAAIGIPGPSAQTRAATWSPSQTLEPSSRRPWRLGLASILVTLAVLGLGAWIWGRRPPPSPPGQSTPFNPEDPRPEPPPPEAKDAPPPPEPGSLPGLPHPPPPPRARPEERIPPKEGLKPPEPPPAENSSPDAGMLESLGKGLEDDPEKSRQRLEEMLQKHPQSPRLHALYQVSCYRSGEYTLMIRGLEKAKAQGVDLLEIGRNPRFQATMRHERRAQRMPMPLRMRMRQLFTEAGGHPPD